MAAWLAAFSTIGIGIVPHRSIQSIRI